MSPARTEVVHTVTCLAWPSCGVLYSGDLAEVAHVAARRHGGELRGGPVPPHSVITETVPVGGGGDGPGRVSPRHDPDRSPRPGGAPAPTVGPEGITGG